MISEELSASSSAPSRRNRTSTSSGPCLPTCSRQPSSGRARSSAIAAPRQVARHGSAENRVGARRRGSRFRFVRGTGSGRRAGFADPGVAGTIAATSAVDSTAVCPPPTWSRTRWTLAAAMSVSVATAMPHPATPATSRAPTGQLCRPGVPLRDKRELTAAQRTAVGAVGRGPGTGAAYRVVVAQILIVEDDPAIRQSLTRALTDRGHAVTSAPTAMGGLKVAVDDRPDVVLLDLGLPDMDGVSMLAMLRAVSDVPVLVTTARDDDVQVIRLLEPGRERQRGQAVQRGSQLDARSRAVLRRVAQAVAGPLVVGGLVMDTAARTATAIE